VIFFKRGGISKGFNSKTRAEANILHQKKSPSSTEELSVYDFKVLRQKATLFVMWSIYVMGYISLIFCADRGHFRSGLYQQIVTTIIHLQAI
jgi:hypothetical protein